MMDIIIIYERKKIALKYYSQKLNTRIQKFRVLIKQAVTTEKNDNSRIMP